MNARLPFVGLLLTSLLAACGGGEGQAARPEAQATALPASATGSPEAFARYAALLEQDDKAEPLSLEGVEPPTSESAEPI